MLVSAIDSEEEMRELLSDVDWRAVLPCLAKVPEAVMSVMADLGAVAVDSNGCRHFVRKTAAETKEVRAEWNSLSMSKKSQNLIGLTESASGIDCDGKMD